MNRKAAEMLGGMVLGLFGVLGALLLGALLVSMGKTIIWVLGQ